eukprot:XP_001705418.1 Hypothetical protein GL50803_36575 [Giardia lamblia ATCC 50803]
MTECCYLVVKDINELPSPAVLDFVWDDPNAIFFIR